MHLKNCEYYFLFRSFFGLMNDRSEIWENGKYFFPKSFLDDLGVVTYWQNFFATILLLHFFCYTSWQNFFGIILLASLSGITFWQHLVKFFAAFQGKIKITKTQILPFQYSMILQLTLLLSQLVSLLLNKGNSNSISFSF